MAHFLGKIEGARSTVTRLGTKRTGVTAQAQGWDIGGRVHVWHDDATGTDYVDVFLTHGSNNPGNAQMLGRFCLGGVGFRKIEGSNE